MNVELLKFCGSILLVECSQVTHGRAVTTFDESEDKN